MMIRQTMAMMRTKDGDWQCVFIIVEKWTVILWCMGIESAKTWHFDTSSDHRLPRMAKSFSVASLPCLWYNYINAAIDLQLLRCVRPSRVCLTLFCLFRRRILELSFLYAQEFLLSRSSSLGGIQEYIDKNYDQKWALHVIALIKVLPSTSALNDWVRSAEQDEEVKVSHRVAAACVATELPQQQ